MDEKRLLEAIREIVRQEISPLKSKVDSMEARVGSLESKFDSLKSEFDSLKSEVDSMKLQVEENTQILRALREHSEVNKAEHDAMKIDMAHMMGDIVGIKESMAIVERATAYNWGQIVDLKNAR